MYTPDVAPIADNLTLSALVAALPLVTVFVTLGLLRWKAHWAGLTALGVALLVAILGYRMPLDLAALSATQGAAFGLFPIMWIVLMAIWLYELTVRSGRFEDLRRVIDTVSDDPRIQAMIIAFCFGGLLEALAGFGAPIAITGVMLLAIGFSKMRAATVVLVANTAPVAFGAIAIPILTAGTLTGIDYHHIGAIVGHQTPLIALFVPTFLAFLADGLRGVKEIWPIAVVVGVAFAAAQWVSATWISVELTDVISSLVGLLAAVLMLRVWKPKGGEAARARLLGERRREDEELAVEAAAAGRAGKATTTAEATRASATDGTTADAADAAGAAGTAGVGLTGSRVFLALFPYLLVIVIFALAKLWTPLTSALAATDVKIPWPGSDGRILTAAGEVSTNTVYSFQWLSSPGTLLLITGIIVAAVYRMKPQDALEVFTRNVVKMRFSILTVVSVLSLAYVMNQAGQTITIGTWIAGTGAAFAFLAPILGWLGTAVTGSDTSANALFATLQQTAALKAGLDPALMVAANTSGGVVGKLISPQNLTIAATAVGLLGKESAILRKVVWWSIGMLVALCLLNGLQSNVLAWMLPQP
ncbi:L-lactate permease [Brevibacterium samyangense]|uniref:L-lactate permease n=1 Tax=Brevibacterium samyangense TaxID=366888 RepID=A0ABN2TEQ3_9MICO